MMNKNSNELIVEEKGKKKKITTEDKIKALLDEQYERMEQMIDDKFRKMDILLDEKLDHTQFRMYNSFKSEIRRWYTGYYNTL